GEGPALHALRPRRVRRRNTHLRSDNLRGSGCPMWADRRRLRQRPQLWHLRRGVKLVRSGHSAEPPTRCEPTHAQASGRATRPPHEGLNFCGDLPLVHLSVEALGGRAPRSARTLVEDCGCHSSRTRVVTSAWTANKPPPRRKTASR